jgi:hypothetical protein
VQRCCGDPSTGVRKLLRSPVLAPKVSKVLSRARGCLPACQRSANHSVGGVYPNSLMGSPSASGNHANVLAVVHGGR